MSPLLMLTRNFVDDKSLREDLRNSGTYDDVENYRG